MLVSEMQLEVLKYNGAMCNFRPTVYTIHEAMIVGQLLAEAMQKKMLDHGAIIACVKTETRDLPPKARKNIEQMARAFLQTDYWTFGAHRKKTTIPDMGV